MKSQVLRYDTTEDEGGKVISRFIIVAVTDEAFPGAIARSEHTLTAEENALVDDGLLGEVLETIAAEALDRLKTENEPKTTSVISSDSIELTSISSEIRPAYVLAKQAAIEEKRKISIEPSPAIKIK